jgi:GTP-binding protein
MDKLKKSQIEPAIELIAETFDLPKELIIPFSAEKGMGRDELVRVIQNALE